VSSKQKELHGETQIQKRRETAMEKAMEFQVHELANIVPPMPEEKFEPFKEDIRVEKLQDPITVYEGKILDGRARYRACLETGVEIRTVELPEDIDPIDFLIRENVLRRHLTPSTGACSAVDAGELLRKLREEARGRQYLGQRIDEGLKGRTDEKIAKLFGTNREYVNKARRLKAEWPQKFEDVKSGKRTIKQASIDLTIRKKEKQNQFDVFVSTLWPEGNHKRNSVKYPGPVPQKYVDSVVHYFTDVGDLVFDPFAGGGITIDACKKMKREHWVCDNGDLALQRPEVHRWDNRDGIPPLPGNPKLTFLDPPYFQMMKGKWGENSISELSREEYLKFWETYSNQLYDFLKPGSYVAFIMADWRDHKDPTKSIWISDYVKFFESAGFRIAEWVQAPLNYASKSAWVVLRDKENKRMTGVSRHLVVFVRDEQSTRPTGPNGGNYDHPRRLKEESHQRVAEVKGEKKTPLKAIHEQDSRQKPPCLRTEADRQIDSRIIRGDCLQELKQIPEESIDLVATDPPYGLRFMGKDWDKAIPPTEVWNECLRVLKPGAFTFVMCTPRQDCLARMILNLEEAGFFIGLTSVYWTNAFGFTKAHNIGRRIDQRNGYKGKIIGYTRGITVENSKGCGRGVVGIKKKPADIPVRELSEEAEPFKRAYAGFQPKPAVEVVIVAMKPRSERSFTEQALKNGKGLTWLDDCRIPFKNESAPFRDLTKQRSYTKNQVQGSKGDLWVGNQEGRFPANLLTGDGVLGDFSRFFSLDAWAEKNLPFLIVRRASTKERSKGLEKMSMKNHHPTVKPIALMAYLVTMGSRPGDVVLDPFMGSGSTCIAAKILDRRYIGIELDQEYVEIAKARLAAHG
jgi:site-specific DNA-methyltransferase (adenine-specific)